MNKYLAFYRRQKMEVEAPTSYAAQQKAAVAFKARKSYEVTVVLCELEDGSVVVHSGNELP